MKKYLTFIMSVFLLACSQNKQESDLSTIKGKWQRGTSKGSVSLFAIKNGGMEEIATSKIDSDSTFCFAITHKEPAFFVVGEKGMQYKNKYEFFFNPGDRLNVVVNDTSYVLVGENTNENKALENWHNLFLPLERSALYNVTATYVDYFPLLEGLLPDIKSYKSSYQGNSVFNEAFKNKRELDVLYSSIYLIGSPRITHPHPEDYLEYYTEIDLKKYTSSEMLMHSPIGIFVLNMSHFILKKFNPDMPDLSPETIDNPALKAEYIIQAASMLKTYEGYLDYEEKYGKLLTTEEQKERFKAIISRFTGTKVGEKAIGFSFPDINGKNVELSDFKGKVVYVDIWATWCGPCRSELPHMKNLINEFEKDNIAFVSISVDAQKDYDKWKEAIAKENLKGVQLFAGNNAKNIMGPYQVKGIPRFILIDKEGNLLSADAPRPSSSEIKGLLKRALK